MSTSKSVQQACDVCGESPARDVLRLYLGSCIGPDDRIETGSVDLGIYDPPFGIGEGKFDQHYKRNSSHVIPGYVEAPQDYAAWTLAWLSEARRVSKPGGSMYVVIGHTHLRDVLNAAHILGLYEINHLIWRYNFGVCTRRKYVTSHYHVLYYAMSATARRTFNVNCRFGSQERDAAGRSLLYQDLEDVFAINKEYAPGEAKNQNKLPDALIRKLVLYSSNPGDLVCDFFLGNFTTAYVARGLGRRVCGYEINPAAYHHHIDRVRAAEFGVDLSAMRPVENVVPRNQGKRVTDAEVRAIRDDYAQFLAHGLSKKDASERIQGKYGRGRFAVKNILDRGESDRPPRNM